ncbi:MAG: hypothetical protein QNJ54_03620 [Prochloraceae cyanobacterium]|nr:hypothetical protein [Prochloraceae cyanobacterium]
MFGLIATIPVMSSRILYGHDILYHLAFSKSFLEQFWNGDLYPRWMLQMNNGFGSPSFFFYPPIPYYFTSLFNPFFSNDIYGWNQLCGASSFCLIASGFTAYIWLKEITNKTSALIAAIVYMAWPYHLVVDLYLRFAFAEYWSFVWMPLILYFSVKIIKNPKMQFFLGLAFSYALLAMTHLPTFIIFFPIPVGYILLFTLDRTQRKKILLYSALAIILSFCLSAIYWFPALTSQKYVSINALWDNDSKKFYNTFLFALKSKTLNKTFWQDFWKYLEIITTISAGVGCCAFLATRTNQKATLRRESYYWFFIVTIVVFMMLPLSELVWHLLPIVQKIQFPWRFNTLLTVAIAPLLALGISEFKTPIKLTKDKMVSIIILLIISLLLSLIEYLPFQKKIYFFGSHNSVLTITTVFLISLLVFQLQKTISNFQKKILIIGLILTTSLLFNNIIYTSKKIQRLSYSNVVRVLEIRKAPREYRPKWVSKEVFNYLLKEPVTNDRKVRTNSKQDRVLIKQWQPRKILVQTNAVNDIQLTIAQFYYQGWTAKIKDRHLSLPVQPSSKGLLNISVPAGDREVLVILEAGIEERIGQIISAIAVAISLLLTTQIKFRKFPES